MHFLFPITLTFLITLSSSQQVVKSGGVVVNKDKTPEATKVPKEMVASASCPGVQCYQPSPDKNCTAKASNVTKTPDKGQGQPGAHSIADCCPTYSCPGNGGGNSQGQQVQYSSFSSSGGSGSGDFPSGFPGFGPGPQDNPRGGAGFGMSGVPQGSHFSSYSYSFDTSDGSDKKIVNEKPKPNST